jgi:hypothetical protein
MREWVILGPCLAKIDERGRPSPVPHGVVDERQPHYFATPGGVI